MMVRREALEDIKIEIKKIIDDIIQHMKDGRIESEPSITDRIVEVNDEERKRKSNDKMFNRRIDVE